MGSAEHDLIKAFEDAFTCDKQRLKRWTAVASRRLDLYGNRIFERHWTPEDIIKEVMARVLEGRRNYDPNKYNGVDHFMYLTISSIIDDELKARKSVVPMEKFVDSKDGGDYKNLYEQKHKTENDFIQKDFEIKEKLEKYYNQLLKDDDAALVFLYWKDGMTSQDIADELGIKKSEVEAAKKRIRYKLTGGKK